ncbi:MAG: hypothetical protein V3V40_06260 [Nitrosomonadaceae bacterium]
MADTADFSVPPDENWVEIAGNDNAEVSGFITVFTQSPVLYRQATSLPSESVKTGHWLEPASDAVEFDLLAGERAYARSLEFDGTLIVTVDG